MRTGIAVLLVGLVLMPYAAQEPDAPKNLIGFLKPGMHVGIVPFENSDRIAIEVYSAEDQAILVDARDLSLEELASKYDRVAREMELARKEAVASLKSTNYGEPKMSIVTNAREVFYRIAAVGEDYILVTYATNTKKRRAFAIRFVSSIQWRDELPFTWSASRIENEPEKVKQ